MKWKLSLYGLVGFKERPCKGMQILSYNHVRAYTQSLGVTMINNVSV